MLSNILRNIIFCSPYHLIKTGDFHHENHLWDLHLSLYIYIDARYEEMVWKMGQITFVSLCINSLFMNEAFLQHQCIMDWERCGGSHLTHYIMLDAPNNKTIFIFVWGSWIHQYMLELIAFSAIHTIASIQRTSHALMLDGALGHKRETHWLCIFFS